MAVRDPTLFATGVGMTMPGRWRHAFLRRRMAWAEVFMTGLFLAPKCDQTMEATMQAPSASVMFFMRKFAGRVTSFR